MARRIVAAVTPALAAAWQTLRSPSGAGEEDLSERPSVTMRAPFRALQDRHSTPALTGSSMAPPRASATVLLYGTVGVHVLALCGELQRRLAALARSIDGSTRVQKHQRSPVKLAGSRCLPAAGS